MKETENINDLWVCKKCGRIGYSKFFYHAIKLQSNNCCAGTVVRFKTWLNYVVNYIRKPTKAEERCKR